MQFIKFFFYALILFNIPSYANENLINKRIDFFKKSDRSVSNIKKLINRLEEKQAAASIGQIILINAWKKAFDKIGISCSQILLTHGDAEKRKNAFKSMK
mgnify:CR=1 FL=1